MKTDLRDRTESLLRKSPGETPSLPLGDVQALVHELQVHQSELEIQNEELRRTQQELTDARDNYRRLYRSVPVGCLTLDAHRTIQDANTAAELLLAEPDGTLGGQRLDRFVVSEDADACYLLLRQAMTSGCQQYADIRFHRNGKEPFWADLGVGPDPRSDAAKPMFWVTLRDISARKQAEFYLRQANTEREATHLAVEARRAALNIMAEAVEARQEAERIGAALRVSEQRIQQALRVSRSFTFDWQPATDMVVRSDSIAAILHIADDTAGAETGQNYFAHVHPDDRTRFVGLLLGLTPDADSYATEYRYVCDDGCVVVLNEVGQATFDGAGHLQRVVGVSTDNTKRKQAEEAITRYSRREALLAKTAHGLLAADEPQRVINDLCAEVMAFLECDIFINFLIDETSDRLHLNACGGLPPEEMARLEWLDGGGTLCGDVARDRKPIILDDIPHSNDPRAARVAAYGMRAYCCHPLIVEEHLRGTLSFGSRRRDAFSEDDISMMAAVSEQVALAMQRLHDREQLRQSELFYRQTLESVPGMSFTTRPDGFSDYMSRQWEDFSGVPLVEQLGDGWITLLHPDDRARTLAAWRTAVQGRTPYDLEYRVRRRDGIYVWFKVRGHAIRDVSGAIVRWFGTAVNIDDLVRAEEQLKASLAEKEVLLKEVHHRVKNNLQVISSLVSLQSAGHTDPLLQAALGNVRDRVRTMALMHEKLYQSADLGAIEFAGYARGLLEQLWRAYRSEGTRVNLRLDLKPVTLPLHSAAPCGLILNELATNALKHAFCDRADGEVTVELQADDAGQVRLAVRDNGVGLPPDIDWRQGKPLGLRLVQMLTTQLRGTVESHPAPDGGTEFEVTFGR